MSLSPASVSALALACVAAASLAVHAQAPPTQAPQPSFRAGTTLVEVSAIVTRDGRPVTDLRAEDFTVLDNGTPQPVVAFERVDLGGVAGPAQRRDFIVVLDDLHVDPVQTSQVIWAATSFLERLGPHDRVAVVRTGPPDEPIEFHVDRDRTRAAIAAFRGQKLSGPTLDGERQIRARAALDVIAQVAEAMRSDAVERRAMLLFGEGHPAFMLEPRINSRQDVHDVYLRFLEVLRQAAIANVAIYTVDPRGLRAPGLASTTTRTVTPAADAISLSGDLMSSSAALASETGGIQTRWTNDLTANYARLVQDSRQYYRLAYAQPDPPPGKRQPATRKISVKVSRPGLQVRARQRYAPVVSKPS